MAFIEHTSRPVRQITVATASTILAGMVHAAPPTVPGNFRSAVYSSTAAELFWNRSVDDSGAVDGYELSRNGERLGVFDALSYFDEALEPGVDYRYELRAVDRDEERSEATGLTLSTVASPNATIDRLETEIAQLQAALAERIPAPVPDTGQTTVFQSGDDGDVQSGVQPLADRFVRNVQPIEDLDGDGRCDVPAETCDGTVTDRLTGLVWLRDGNCYGEMTWQTAVANMNALSDDGSGACGLADGSAAGDWRLPNIREALSLIEYTRFPTVPDGLPIDDIQTILPDSAPLQYWTSTESVGLEPVVEISGAYTLSYFTGTVSRWAIFDSIRFYALAVRNPRND